MLRILALAAGLLLLSSCQPDGPEREKGHLRLNIYSEPPSLHPFHATDTTSSAVLRFLFDGLTRLDSDGKVLPSVAKAIEVSEDGTVYTFRLRESRWTNGDPVTADDFVYTYRKMLDPATASRVAYKLYILKNGKAVSAGEMPLDSLGVAAPDPYTLVLELEHPAPYFLDMTAAHYMFPVHPPSDRASESWARESGPRYVNNGPFTLERWRHHNELVMKKNDHYWDRGAVKLKRVTLSMVEDAHTELSMFEEGEIDWAGAPLSPTLPTDALPTLREEGLLHWQPLVASYMFLFNVNHPPLQNKKIRQALSYAINRKAITENITQAQELPTTSIVPQDISARTAPLFNDGDEAAARRLFEEGLKELGMTRETMAPIALSYNTSDHHHRIAQYVQQQWNRILGIKVTLRNSEWKAYLGDLNSCRFDIARLGWWADYRDPVSFLELWRYQGNGINCIGWQNATYNTVLEKADYTVDVDARFQLLLQAEKILAEEMPVAAVYTPSNVWVQHPDLKGVCISNPAVIDFKWAYFDGDE